MALAFALATVRDAPFIVDVLRAADDLALEATRDGSPRAVDLLSTAIDDPADELTAIAAVHAIGRVFDDGADAVLSDLLSHPRPFLREHAAWTLASRLPRLDAIGRLVALVAGGGFPGMLAQRTLQHWARSAADHVALGLEGALTAVHDAAARARLVETLGLVPGDVAGRAVLRVAADLGEDVLVRVAAVAALGDVAPDLRTSGVLQLIGRGDDELAAVARLAELDVRLALSGPAGPAAAAGPGATIAQLFLHADIDRELSRAGAGDNGGVATLLLRLGDALAQDPQIGRVITMSRSGAEASEAGLRHACSAGPGHLLTGVPMLQPVTGSAQAWPARVAAERGIRRVLRTFGPIDALHLRMADVGSMAAEAVAQELRIPVVFTLAPDPHAVIHSLDMTGALTRAGFGRADEQEHYWFRARLVQRLAASAAHDVLFPRPELDHDLQELLGIDRAAEPRRFTVVPEGIDLSVTDRAAAQLGVAAQFGADADADAVPDLTGLVSALPGHRHGLPIVLSVGRLHRVKGMASLVQAWASDPALRDRCNLLIVGGDLAGPSDDERGQLDVIGTVLADAPEAAAGLILAGHRPNDVVARWLAAARSGAGPMIAPGGVYACGSLKEEFGLAILEAMAAGLIVVAPATGGPATYVEQGVTGVLVDTRSPAAIGEALSTALDLAGAAGHAQRAASTHDFIGEHYTVQAMARALAGVYAGVSQRARR